MSSATISKHMHRKVAIKGKAPDGSIVFDGQICYRVHDKPEIGEEWDMCVDDNLSYMMLNEEWAGSRHLISKGDSPEGFINFMAREVGSNSEARAQVKLELGGEDGSGNPFRVFRFDSKVQRIYRYNKKGGKKWYEYKKLEADDSKQDLNQENAVVIELSNAESKGKECCCKEYVKGSEGAKRIHWKTNGLAMFPSYELA